MKTEIRKATMADTKTLQEIARRTIRADYTSFLGEEKVAGFIESGEPDQYIEKNIEHCTVICLDDKIAGFSVYQNHFIELMMVDHDFHRQGVGSALLGHCEGVLFEIHDEIELESFEPNEKANNFYRKNGWTATGPFPDDASGANKFLFFKKKGDSGDKP